MTITKDEVNAIIQSVLDLPLMSCRFKNPGADALCRYSVYSKGFHVCVYNVNRVTEICMLDGCMKTINKGRRRIT